MLGIVVQILLPNNRDQDDRWVILNLFQDLCEDHDLVISKVLIRVLKLK
ncbi:hypothetical protein GYB29_13525 [bacterium]|nr:hypothetical protein [bacterium]